jgi:hypothetical protein
VSFEQVMQELEAGVGIEPLNSGLSGTLRQFKVQGLRFKALRTFRVRTLRFKVAQEKVCVDGIDVQ